MILYTTIINALGISNILCSCSYSPPTQIKTPIQPNTNAPPHRINREDIRYRRDPVYHQNNYYPEEYYNPDQQYDKNYEPHFQEAAPSTPLYTPPTNNDSIFNTENGIVKLIKRTLGI